MGKHNIKKILDIKYKTQNGLSKDFVLILNKWNREMYNNDYKPVTRTGKIFLGKKFLEFIYKECKKDKIINIEEDDIQRYIEHLKKSGIKQSTLNNYKIRMCYFLEWFIESLPDKIKDKYEKFKLTEPKSKYQKRRYKLVSKIKLGNIKGIEHIDDKQTLKPEDIKKMISCGSDYEACLISLLFETGARANELIGKNGVKIKDVDLTENDAIIKIRNSKRRFETEPTYRKEVIVDSFGYLRQLLRMHPWKEDKESPLFWHRKRLTHYGEKMEKATALGYDGFLFTVKKLGIKAGIQKKFNPHWFRHSIVSQDAKKYSDAKLRQKYGWVKGSNMVARYTHHSEEEFIEEERIIKHGGTYTSTKIKDLKPNFVNCPNCHLKQDLNKIKFCGNCGCGLNRDIVEKIMKRRRLTESLVGIENMPEEIRKLKSIMGKLLIEKYKNNKPEISDSEYEFMEEQYNQQKETEHEEKALLRKKHPIEKELKIEPIRR